MKMKATKTTTFMIVIVIAVAMMASTVNAQEKNKQVMKATGQPPDVESRQDLAETFATPARRFGPKLYWWWQKESHSKGYCVDNRGPFPPTEKGLSEMIASYAEAGFWGVHVLPCYPDRPELDALIGHAARECARHGMSLVVHTGWGNSAASGEWNDPEHALQALTYSLTNVTGPKASAGTLPKPCSRNNFYRDVAVVAFPNPDPDVPEAKPVVTAKGIDEETLSHLRDGLPFPTKYRKPREEAMSITFDYGRPVRKRVLTANIKSVAQVALSRSDDGETFIPLRETKKVTWCWELPELTPWTMAFEAPPSRFYRVDISSVDRGCRVDEIDLLDGARADRLYEQALYAAAYEIIPTPGLSPDAALAVDPATVIDLTDRLAPDGSLNWEVPVGRWTIMRVGRTNNGAGVPGMVGPGVKGLQVDWLSEEALEHHYEHWLRPFLEAAGPEGRPALKAMWSDSWESGSFNWTPKMPEEFKARNGYALWRYLPAFAGYLIKDRNHTDKFFWDWRRTVADMVADIGFGHVKEIMNRHGLKYEAQVYGGTPGEFWDTIQCGGRVDVVQNEYWSSRRVGGPRIVGLQSAAHVYGNGILVGGEHMSEWWSDLDADPPYVQRGDDPVVSVERMKAPADNHFILGVNQMTYGTYNPAYLNADWSRYLSRCQVPLREGRNVADVCYLYGEGAPLRTNTRDLVMPAGYKFDFCSAELILDPRTRVENGHLTLPSGARYRVLLLPPDTEMTPELARRVKALAEAGAVIAGIQPKSSPSFRGNPDADSEVVAIGKELWGEPGGDDSPRRVGKGRVYWAFDRERLAADQAKGPMISGYGRRLDPGLEKVFETESIQPDLTTTDKDLRWVHRHDATSGRHIYFLTRQGDPVTSEVSFRVAGLTPSLWNPKDGTIAPVEDWTEKDGRSLLKLPFEKDGATFVVFEPESTLQN